MVQVSRKKVSFSLGLILLMGIMTAGQIFAADFPTEEEWLRYMREEEKLARDVYKVLYAKWRMRVFNNIAASEQKHMDAIEALLDKYNLDDPVQNEGAEGVGKFTNPDIQALYYQLITEGKKSKYDALMVGDEIETLDILDLKNAMEVTSATTHHLDVLRVYANLLAGSYNHLAAFESQLQNH